MSSHPLTQCLRRRKPAVVSKRVITAIAWRLPCTDIGSHANAIYVRSSGGGAVDCGGFGTTAHRTGPGLQPIVGGAGSSRECCDSITLPGRTGMISRPEKILLVTERPLLALTFKELLDTAGWDLGCVLLGPDELDGSLGPEMAALVVIDAEAGVPWETYRGLCDRSARSRFVVWCPQVTPQLVQAAMEAGVHGLLSVRLTVSDAAQALVRVWRGERQFRFDGELQPRVSRESGLTPREQQVVALVMEGRRNREIAEILHTTEGSVKVHINRI